MIWSIISFLHMMSLSNIIFLKMRILKTCTPYLMKSKFRGEEQSGNNTDAAFNYITDFKWGSPKNKEFCNFHHIKNKENNTHYPWKSSQCKQDSNWIWNYLIQVKLVLIDFIVQVSMVICDLEYTCTFHSWKLLYDYN